MPTSGVSGAASEEPLIGTPVIRAMDLDGLMEKLRDRGNGMKKAAILLLALPLAVGLLTACSGGSSPNAARASQR
jgi:hypothetical protein